MGSQSMKNDLELIKVMLDYCEYIESDLMTLENDIELLFENKMAQRSISFSLEQIGEHAKNLSNELKSKYDNIEWKKPSGMRDVIAHGYDSIDLDEIWNTINNDIPVLKRSLIEIKDDLTRN